jgi:glyoxylase-like metal-dependent hydrolase (beta-lactamase superfamily II)/rhodanese-related sulfurtransferase
MKFIILLLFSTTIFAKNVITGEELQQQASKQIHNINTQELLDILDKNPDAVLIDVRTEFEIDQVGTIKRGANVVMPRGWLEFRIADYDKNSEIITYCGQNLRSPLAAKTLMDMGYTNVKNYADGYFVWRDQGLGVTSSDNYKESYLYNPVKQVVDGVYTSIGEANPSTYLNSGHNNNLSFIVGDDAVMVFNAGGSYLLAKSMHEEIKKITNKPVKYVVLENAQGHAMLGSSYWQEQGAQVIAHKLAYEEIKNHGVEILALAQRRIGNKTAFTEVVLPDETYTEKKVLDLGNLKVELLYLGASHSPDDIQAWIPSKKLLISGDTAFNERMLPVFEHTDVDAWAKTWDKVEALEPQIIIPGHGDVTDLATTTKFTKGYLTYMSKKVKKVLDDGGTLSDAYKIDQSQFRDWGTYRELHLRNAARIFNHLEFDY